MTKSWWEHYKFFVLLLLPLLHYYCRPHCSGITPNYSRLDRSTTDVDALCVARPTVSKQWRLNIKGAEVPAGHWTLSSLVVKARQIQSLSTSKHRVTTTAIAMLFFRWSWVWGEWPHSPLSGWGTDYIGYKVFISSSQVYRDRRLSLIIGWSIKHCSIRTS